MRWENVYVFISSTFNDMHAERDYLVKIVFPELSEWCDKRKLRLIDIDLRWGVTAADSETKNAVKVCLNRIDECRPFFLCFLGQRRGWVPNEEDISIDTFDSFPLLSKKHYTGKTSITEMEILHALIDPLNTPGKIQMAEHALFFLRDPGYLEKIPHSTPRAVYTNESDPNPALADTMVKHWRENMIPEIGRPVFYYTTGWQENNRTPEIALPLYVPTTAPYGSEEWKRAYTIWAKQWAAFNVKVDDNGEITGSNLDKANAHNDILTSGRLGNFLVNERTLAEIVVEQMQEAIAARFPEHMELQPQTSQQQEIDQQEYYQQISAEGFIAREEDKDALYDYINNTDCRPFALVSGAGVGKTSFLAHFISKYECSQRESLHYRFIGASDGSSEISRIWYGIFHELSALGKIKGEINEDGILTRISDYFHEASQDGKTLIIIDALDQLNREIPDLQWLSLPLPPNLKLIVSFKLGLPVADYFYEQQREKDTMIFYHLRTLSEPGYRKMLIESYLSRYFKELDEHLVNKIIYFDGAENPLFLKILLSELRVSGSFHDLDDMIQSFGNTPFSAFEAMLNRLENDPAYASIHDRDAVRYFLGMLAYSRYGLKEKELAHNEEQCGALRILVRQIRPFLLQHDGLVSFRYASFVEVAKLRYHSDKVYYEQCISKINYKNIFNILNWYKTKYDGDVAIDLKRIQDLRLLRDFAWNSRQRDFYKSNGSGWAEHVRSCIRVDAALRDDPKDIKWKVLKRVISDKLKGDDILREENTVLQLLKAEAIHSDPPRYYYDFIEDRLGYIPDDQIWVDPSVRHVRDMLNNVALPESLEFIKEFAYISVREMVQEFINDSEQTSG